MNEDEFMKTKVKVACILRMSFDDVTPFKKDLAELVKKFNADIIYHTVSPYKLVIKEEKPE
jgi:adenine-specific DNA methylase